MAIGITASFRNLSGSLVRRVLRVCGQWAQPLPRGAPARRYTPFTGLPTRECRVSRDRGSDRQAPEHAGGRKAGQPLWVAREFRPNRRRIRPLACNSNASQGTIRDWVAKATMHMWEAPLTHEIIVAAQGLPLQHQDLADRFLAATAEVLDVTLVTADRRLLGFGQDRQPGKPLSTACQGPRDESEQTPRPASTSYRVVHSRDRDT
jgi:hypothetical protein